MDNLKHSFSLLIDRKGPHVPLPVNLRGGASEPPCQSRARGSYDCWRPRALSPLRRWGLLSTICWTLVTIRMFRRPAFPQRSRRTRKLRFEKQTCDSDPLAIPARVQMKVNHCLSDLCLPTRQKVSATDLKMSLPPRWVSSNHIVDRRACPSWKM